VAGVSTENQIETKFLLNFHSLLKQGNYSLLTQAEYQCAAGDGFLLDVECTVRAPPPSLSHHCPLTTLLSPIRPFIARPQFRFFGGSRRSPCHLRASQLPFDSHTSFHLPADEGASHDSIVSLLS
jgi:hypothetical protein